MSNARTVDDVGRKIGAQNGRFIDFCTCFTNLKERDCKPFLGVLILN